MFNNRKLQSFNSSKQRTSGSRQRGVFTKLLKDGDATMDSYHHAIRFLEGMDTFESKADLIFVLEDKRNHGLRRVRDVVSFINDIDDIDHLLVPLLQHIVNAETARPMYVPSRNRILMSIYMVKPLLEMMVEMEVVMHLSQNSASNICHYLVEITSAFVEARHDSNIQKLAKSLRDRGDISTEANKLCSILLVDCLSGVNSKHQATTLKATQPARVASWINDEIPPGGRHDNDFLNYRDVRILPTAEELCCPSKSWLPLASGENAFLEDPATQLLDKSFRLLREDAILSMKSMLVDPRRVWEAAYISNLDTAPNVRNGEVIFHVRLNFQDKRGFDWERSNKILMYNSVVAFCVECVPKLMGLVVVRDHTTPSKWLNDPTGPRIGVMFPSEVDFKLAMEDVHRNIFMEKHIDALQLRLQTSQGEEASDLRIKMNGLRAKLKTYDMIEVSSSFFTYEPVLKSLQDMYSVPFLKELTARQGVANFANRPDYLPEILVMPEDKFSLGHQCDVGNWSSKEVADYTSLDETQADALFHAFSNRVSLIQGPPGTGKTFIGALIARMIRINTDESILCLCYTNHALDQFLEYMLDSAEKRLVRIGGRSKSQRLAAYQLRELGKHRSSEPSDGKRRVRQVDAMLHEQHDKVKSLVESVRQELKWNTDIKPWLMEEHPNIYNCFSCESIEDGFQIIGKGSKRMREDYLWNCWIDGMEFPHWLVVPFTHAEAETIQAIWGLSYEERVDIYNSWRNELLFSEMDDLRDTIKMTRELINEKRAVMGETDCDILQNARVIGATTTGAAQYRALLSTKKPGVIIVEEAGEVLEAHVLSSLDPSATKHLILIGDHCQLRPKIESYQLTAVSGGGYNLDCSLFERLVLSGMPSVALATQHRMRPEISRFIREQTYPSLVDHPSVMTFPSIRGVTNNVIFVDHNHFEDSHEAASEVDNSLTKANSFEAEFCVQTVRYFLMQGYKPSSIVILTPYLGQLIRIIDFVKTQLKEVTAILSEQDGDELANVKDDLDDNFAEVQNAGMMVRCSSIDNFQGEEADIIIVSLVRSNPQGKIGFLKEEQRVNVLMSRARHGMFIVGNSQTFRSSHSGRHVWNPIFDKMKSSGQLRKGLPTCCQLHPDDEPVELCCVEDFRTLRPNGGCNRMCNFRLNCGHMCRLNCHPFDKKHETSQIKCFEPCVRIPSDCPSNHVCPKMCYQDCGSCSYKVGPIRLDCGHSISSAMCHLVNSIDGMSSLTRTCQQRVNHSFEICHHTCETTCANANSLIPKCPSKCGQTLDECGHPCKENCGHNDKRHNCGQRCERLMFCGHSCNRDCHIGKDCPPCNKPCSVKCSHSACPRKCNIPCSSCIEPCDWVCDHQGRCPLVCGAPCSRLPCNKRCDKILACGHRCPSVCGEICPSAKFCHTCCDDMVKLRVCDIIMISTYKDHNVDDDPIIFLPCGHFFSTSTLDGHLAISEVYHCDDKTGSFLSLKPLSEANINEKPKSCPECRSMIHSINRYGRLLRLSELRGLERKQIMTVMSSLQYLLTQAEDSTKPIEESKLVDRLKELERRLLKTPMRTVYEACRGEQRNVFDIPVPPVAPLIQVRQALAGAHVKMVKEKNDLHYQAALGVLHSSMTLADETQSIRSGASIRLSLCSILLQWETSDAANHEGMTTSTLKTEVTEYISWILDRKSLLSDDIVTSARKMQEDLEYTLDHRRLVEQVVMAMHNTTTLSVIGRNNYGASWSDHWYECSNGHPYFIGECGGAMQEARCIECHEIVGGSGHSLRSTSRRATGDIAQVFSRQHGS